MLLIALSASLVISSHASGGQLTDYIFDIADSFDVEISKQNKMETRGSRAMTILEYLILSPEQDETSKQKSIMRNEWFTFFLPFL